MYVLACIPVYGDRGRDFCFDRPGSQEGAPECGLGCGTGHQKPAKSPRCHGPTHGHLPGLGSVLFVDNPAETHDLTLSPSRPISLSASVSPGTRTVVFFLFGLINERIGDFRANGELLRRDGYRYQSALEERDRWLNPGDQLGIMRLADFTFPH
jgi:hypothetical protein